MHEELREQGNVVSLNRVRRLMKKNGIAARHKRKFRATTDSRHNLPVAPNRLEQDFVTERPDQVWLTDVTYLWTDEGWLYLACVLDLYSRLIVGWAMSERQRPASCDRGPGDGLLPASSGARSRSPQRPRLGVLQSRLPEAAQAVRHGLLDEPQGQTATTMRRWRAGSRRLKVERVNTRRYATRAQARSEVFSYIETFYNPRRRHSSLGYVSPREFERRFAAKEAA